MERKIVFLDVDGTLTGNHEDISPKVKSAIRQLREAGHLVFVCTGRNYAGAKNVIDLGFDGAICSAGGYILVGDQLIYETHLAPEEVRMARDVFERNGVLYNLEANDVTFQSQKMNALFVKARGEEKTNSEMQRLMREQEEQFNIQPLEAYDKHPIPVQKMCFICQRMEQLEEPRALLQDRFNFVIHDIFSKVTINGEIISRDCNKGMAVERVC